MEKNKNEKLSVPAFLACVAEQVKEARGKQWTIYFLFLNNDLIYIGISSNLGERLATHRGNKRFDRALYIETESYAQAFALENVLLKLLKPSLNSRGITDYPSYGLLKIKDSDEAFRRSGLIAGHKRDILTNWEREQIHNEIYAKRRKVDEKEFKYFEAY